MTGALAGVGALAMASTLLKACCSSSSRSSASAAKVLQNFGPEITGHADPARMPEGRARAPPGNTAQAPPSLSPSVAAPSAMTAAAKEGINVDDVMDLGLEILKKNLEEGPAKAAQKQE